MPRFCLIMPTESSRMVRVVRPRKSIFSSPMRPRAFISYCVVISSLFDLYSGTISVRGRGEITTPAAWVEAWRGGALQAQRYFDQFLYLTFFARGFELGRLL